MLACARNQYDTASQDTHALGLRMPGNVTLSTALTPPVLGDGWFM